MCGIIGYTGNENAVDILIDGLEALEYRGYDSSGIAVFNSGKINIIKSVGKIANMKEKVKSKGESFSSDCGIGHTRWATHGEPSDKNAHPHYTENLALVHNGIIENYLELKKELIKCGYTFVSDTDTEVAAKLIDKFYVEKGEPFSAICAALQKIRGSYAFGIVFEKYPDMLFATRKDSPLICASDENGCLIASDVTAILKKTKNYYMLEEGEIAIIEKSGMKFYDFSKNEIQKELKTANWSVESADKGKFPHYMIKEINEEPKVIEKTVSERVVNGLPNFEKDGIGDELFDGISRIFFVACGTAMHAGMVGKTVIEKLARVPVNVEIASEFRYADPVLTKNDLVVVISQSGETADTLAALRLAKENGCKTLGVVNVVGSSIARESDYVIYTEAGPEIAVASTKAYSVQISIMYLLGLRLSFIKETLPLNTIKKYTKELSKMMPYLVSTMIDKSNSIKKIAEELKDTEDLFFIGRGIDYSLSMEGSLKLKEISYIHSEAYAAGELKHGTISLITDNVPVIAVATSDALYEKTVSNIKEVKARGAKIILICRADAKGADEIADRIICVPESSEIFAPFTAVCALQLIAYHTSVIKGCDVDKPRNLAKSVTVE